jgi:hypothetical protein
VHSSDNFNIYHLRGKANAAVLVTKFVGTTYISDTCGFYLQCSACPCHSGRWRSGDKLARLMFIVPR